MKDDHAFALERLEKEIADLKEKESLARESTVEEYKSPDNFQEALEQASSKYFGEGFDLCKK